MRKLIFLAVLVLITLQLQAQKFVYGDLRVTGNAYVTGTVYANTAVGVPYLNVDSIVTDYLWADVFDIQHFLIDSVNVNYMYADSFEIEHFLIDSVIANYIQADSTEISYIKADSLSITTLVLDSIDVSYIVVDSSAISYIGGDSSNISYMVSDSSLISYVKTDSLLIGSQKIVYAAGDSIPDITYVNTNYSGSLTDGAPTEAQIIGIAGTAASVGPGFKAVIKDTDGTGLYYLCISTGTAWYYFTGTLAL
jgi:hypothetical protein